MRDLQAGAEQTSVLITGGNKGLGFETARRLGGRGWTVFLGSRDQGRGQAAADKLTAGGAKVLMVPLDVTSDESVAPVLPATRSAELTRTYTAAFLDQHLRSHPQPLLEEPSSRYPEVKFCPATCGQS